MLFGMNPRFHCVQDAGRLGCQLRYVHAHHWCLLAVTLTTMGEDYEGYVALWERLRNSHLSRWTRLGDLASGARGGLWTQPLEAC